LKFESNLKTIISNEKLKKKSLILKNEKTKNKNFKIFVKKLKKNE